MSLWCFRRSYSGVSVDSLISVDPRSDNYDSSESESDRNEHEASVLAHKHVRTAAVHTYRTFFPILKPHKVTDPPVVSGNHNPPYCCRLIASAMLSRHYINLAFALAFGRLVSYLKAQQSYSYSEIILKVMISEFLKQICNY